MAMALDLARLGLGRTSPNPAVGAVIVKNGRVMGAGFHKRAGLPHAEIEALTSPPAPLLTKERVAAARRTGEVHKGATMYVTLEPCCHHGRTPPCTDAIIKSGIKEVVVGMKDPDRNVSGKGIQILRKAGIRVRVGTLRRECELLNEAYVKHRKSGMPFVILKIASTMDGKVGPGWITGSESREYAQHIRDTVDGILVGIQTVLKDNPRLTTRFKDRRGHDPIRIILDSRMRIPRTAKVLKVKSQAPTWIATTVKSSTREMARHLLVCRSFQGHVDLRDLLRKLADRGIVSLLVEGGPTVWASFLDQKLADKAFFFLAPKVLRDEGIPIRRMPRLNHATCRMVGADLLIEGHIR